MIRFCRWRVSMNDQIKSCQDDSINESNIVDGVYIGKTLIYVRDKHDVDYVTDKNFNTYLSIRPSQPKLVRTFSTLRDLLACIKQL